MDVKEQSFDLNVATVDLALATAGDHNETARLLKALQNPGYFYLDCQGMSDWKDVVEQSNQVYKLAEEYFDQPNPEKRKDVRGGIPSSSDLGYKSCETDESFEMSTYEMRNGNLELPLALEKHIQVLNVFHGKCYSATLTLMRRLSDVLNVSLLAEHDEQRPSESGLKLIAEPSVPRAVDVLENKHHDSGTLTMLFYEKESLQVCLSSGENPDERQKWVFVPPPPRGHALVHGANSLARLTGGVLRSPLHRVSQPSDGAGKRYFLSYFLRPASHLHGDNAIICA